jgi:UDPglucose 6-dehydrogenase
VGFGGSCFPKDVNALIHTADGLGFDAELIKAVHNVNERQKQLLAQKIKARFENEGGIKGKTLALWGLAFKANTDDIRKAPALDLIAELTAAGMRVKAYDPVAGENSRKALADNALVEVVKSQYEALEGADCLAVVTDWHQFRNPNFEQVKQSLSVSVIFDGRNLYSPEFMADHGIEYICIGRQPTAPAKAASA